MKDQQYQFIDKTGKCFESFQSIGEDDVCKRYNDFVGALLRASNDGGHFFCVGDMLAFRDDLVAAGFQWGKDFYVRKVDENDK